MYNGYCMRKKEFKTPRSHCLCVNILTQRKAITSMIITFIKRLLFCSIPSWCVLTFVWESCSIPSQVRQKIQPQGGAPWVSSLFYGLQTWAVSRVVSGIAQGIIALSRKSLKFVYLARILFDSHCLGRGVGHSKIRYGFHFSRFTFQNEWFSCCARGAFEAQPWTNQTRKMTCCCAPGGNRFAFSTAKQTISSVCRSVFLHVYVLHGSEGSRWLSLLGLRVLCGATQWCSG